MNRVNEIFESGELFDGRYKLIDLLSTEGGSADVWLAIDNNTLEETLSEDMATKVVIKIYRPKNLIDIEGEEKFRKEFKRVFNCHHEHIIQPTNFSIYEEMPYLVLPYCPAGSSEKLVGCLDNEEEIWKYIYEVASGLAYLHDHSPRIIHLDIKPANVLIDDNGNYAITDFGISADMSVVASEGLEDASGTFAYMAPERFRHSYTPLPQSDIWAFGATLYEIVTGNVPFGEDGGSIQSESTPIPPINSIVSDSVIKLINSCLAFDINQRPSAQSIVDTVLKKRYSREKRNIGITLCVFLTLAAGIIIYLSSHNSNNAESYITSLMVSADSIVNSQNEIIKKNKGITNSNNITELKKAIVLYNNVIKDSQNKSKIQNNAIVKNQLINQLINLIEEYEFTESLVNNAMLTEMEDSVHKYSLILEQQKLYINQLIQDMK